MRQVLRVRPRLLHSSRIPAHAQLLATTQSHWCTPAASRCTAPLVIVRLHWPTLARFICPVWNMQQSGVAAAPPCTPRLGPSVQAASGVWQAAGVSCLSLLQAFRVACHFGDSEQEVHDSLRISSSAVFNGVLMFVLKEVSPPAGQQTQCRKHARRSW